MKYKIGDKVKTCYDGYKVGVIKRIETICGSPYYYIEIDGEENSYTEDEIIKRA